MLIHIHIQLQAAKTFTSENTGWWKINMEKKNKKPRDIKKWHKTTPHASFYNMQIQQ
jgi:hypothetical protein